VFVKVYFVFISVSVFFICNISLCIIHKDFVFFLQTTVYALKWNHIKLAYLVQIDYCITCRIVWKRLVLEMTHAQLFKVWPLSPQSFSAVVPNCGTAPLGVVRSSRGAVKEKWAVGGALGDPFSKYIFVVLQTLSDQMS